MAVPGKRVERSHKEHVEQRVMPTLAEAGLVEQRVMLTLAEAGAGLVEQQVMLTLAGAGVEHGNREVGARGF